MAAPHDVAQSRQHLRVQRVEVLLELIDVLAGGLRTLAAERRLGLQRVVKQRAAGVDGRRRSERDAPGIRTVEVHEALVPVEPPDRSGVARGEDVAQPGLVGPVRQHAGRVEVLREVEHGPAQPSREVV